MKGAILFSTSNPASLNIMRHLVSDWAWQKRDERYYSFSACGKERCCAGLEAFGFDQTIIDIVPPSDTEAERIRPLANLPGCKHAAVRAPGAKDAACAPAAKRFDYLLYASTHKSEAQTPSLTAHIPGNWDSADFGGSERTLNMAYCAKLKQILQLLYESAKKHGLDWPVCMEVDHHGPTPDGGKWPLLFVEIGSAKEQWENELAGKVVAEAMMKALARPAPVVKAYLGVGGGHYAPKFTPFMLGSEGRAVGHVLAKYCADTFDDKMLKEAIGKTLEPVQGVLVDWKGLSGEQRARILPLIEKSGLSWEKI